MTARSPIERLRAAYGGDDPTPGLAHLVPVVDRQIDLGLQSMTERDSSRHLLVVADDAEAAARLVRGRLRRATEDHGGARGGGDVRLLEVPRAASMTGSIDAFFKILAATLSSAGGVLSSVGQIAAHLGTLIGATPKGSDLWFSAFARLGQIIEQRGLNLVLFVPDYDRMMSLVFDTPEKESFLRDVVQHRPGIMIVGVSAGRAVDDDYEARMFHNFQKVVVTTPSPEAMLAPLSEAIGRARAAQVRDLGVAQFALLSSALGVFGARESLLVAMMDHLAIDSRASPEEVMGVIERSGSDGSLLRLSDLSPRRMAIMSAVVAAGEPASVARIAAQLGVASSDITSDIGRLREAGVLEAGEPMRDGPGRPSIPIAFADRRVADAVEALSWPASREREVALCSGPRRALVLLWAWGLFGPHLRPDQGVIRELIAGGETGEAVHDLARSAIDAHVAKAAERWGSVISEDWIRSGVAVSVLLHLCREGGSEDALARTWLITSEAEPALARPLRLLVRELSGRDPGSYLEGGTAEPLRPDLDLARVAERLRRETDSPPERKKAGGASNSD